jgi:tetratricopeptide (TPR) repeat protein
MPRKYSLLLLLALIGSSAYAANPSWVEVHSAHFTVVTDAGEKQGRHVIDQFERMRWVFQTLFPKMNVDPISPIVVIAVKDQKEFQTLEPQAYLSKGALNLAGLFMRAPDKNYMLLRLDTGDQEHPWATVYHEYTHLQIGDGIEWMPLWLNEGLAEFFENTEIDGNIARLGQPSRNDLIYLQQNRLIPLETLFRVDANSPYYHEEQRGSVFYAESWALTHYLETTDAMNHTTHVATYAQLVSQHQDPVAAARTAFGDLNKLQMTLDEYTRKASYQYFKLTTPTISEAAFTVQPLSAAQADARRADLLAYVGRTADARILLGGVLQADPNNVLAHETMGYLAFRDGQKEEAKKWYGQAVALDSQSYLANYYFGILSLMEGSTGDDVEKSLRKAMQLNSRFAPAFDALAGLLVERHGDLENADLLDLAAVQMEPGNLEYRLHTAMILMDEKKYDDCLRVLQAAVAVAKTPEQVEVVQSRIGQVQLIKGGTTGQDASTTQTQVVTKIITNSAGNKDGGGSVQSDGAATDQALPKPKHEAEAPHGRMLVIRGVIHGVTCSYPAQIELRVEGPARKVSLFANNFYKLNLSAANFTPKGDVHPCEDLEGMKAEVEYFVTADKTVDGQIVAVMMMK